MSIKLKPHIEITLVAKAMEPVLSEWRKIGSEDSESAAIAREELILQNEKLSAAFYKSDYTKRHIDWDYAVQLFYAVLHEDKFADAKGFADQLNAALESTAKQRDFIVIIPLGFPRSIGIFRKPMPIKTSFVLGSFKLSPKTATAAALNKLLAANGAVPVSTSSFVHQAKLSHNALSAHPLLTFETHSSPDAIRFRPNPNVRRLIWLIELFGRIFDADDVEPFGQKSVSQHIFIVNKKSGELNRIPSHASLAITLPFSSKLVKALKRPELGTFLELLEPSGAGNSLPNRLKNALSFFGRAVNEQDRLTRFLFLVIAMEALFSRDKNAPIKVTLADYATILCFKASDRNDVHKDLREIYDVRSSIVHGGVSIINPLLLAKAEQLAVRAVYCSLALAVSVKDGSGTLEKRFFDRLHEMKIGIKPNNLRLPPWPGYNSPEND